MSWLFSVPGSSFLPLLALAILLPLPIALYRRARRHHAARASTGARRYPHLDPILGLDLLFQTWRDFRRGELSAGLRRRHLAHGPTFVTTNLGADCIYTIEPDNIHSVTTRDFDKFGKSAWVAEAAKHVGPGVLLNEGPAWRHSRAMLKPIFSQSALEEPASLEPHVRNLVDRMRSLSSEAAGAFDFHELASMLTLDMVTGFLFGRSTNCLGSPEEEEGRQGMHFLSLVRDFEGPSGKFIALGPLAWLGLLPCYRRLIGLVVGMKSFFRAKLDDIIAEPNICTAGPGRKVPPEDLSPSVFRSMKAAGVSEDRIQGELQNIFFASYDTTSAFLSNLMYVLLRHGDVQSRLREEIACLQGRPPSRKDLAGLRFLRLVMMEGDYVTFRIHWGRRCRLGTDLRCQLY